MTESAASDTGSDAGNDGQFIFVACQPASQQICKREIAARLPGLSPAFSRPGFLTWKSRTVLPPRFNLPLTFGRTFGWSEGGFAADTVEDAAKHLAARLASGLEIHHVHIWQRAWTGDPRRLDDKAQSEVDALIEAAGHLGETPRPVNQVADPDNQILDVIRIDDGNWWIGHHIAGTTAQRWPGGIPEFRTPQSMVSRAWLKTAEAIAWSGITISRDDVCAEIGSAPGGSCQRLLELGAKHIIAIDPADMNPDLLKDPRLKHLRKRGRDVPHRELSEVTWLFADSNVAPAHTLDTVEALATGAKTHFRGLVLTLKFSDPAMLEEIGNWIERVKSWGFRYVRTRQLAWGRQEICLVALRQKSVRRFRG